MNLDLPPLSRTARYLVAVSGGRDSVALLHALIEAGFTRLIVCHLDHGLRARASAADARFVASLARRLGLELETEKIDAAKVARETGESIETAARHARYAFFARVARRRRCRTLFLAHHAGDQVETVLFNLFRGSGRAGLGGMSADSERIEGGVRLRLLRPLLGVWREEIDAYLTQNGWTFREDASNESRQHTRNRIRHDLIPALEAVFGRDVRGAVWRVAAILRDEETWLSALMGPAQTGAELPTPVLKAQPAAWQRRQILAWLRQNGVPNAGFEEVESVRSLLEPGAVAKVNLPGDRHARRRAKRLFLE